MLTQLIYKNGYKQKSTEWRCNSFNGLIKSGSRYYYADTLLVETYNQFNKAIKNNNIVGNKSAEEYYQQLNNKYPATSHLDAKSSLPG
ncbi:MAG: hypothetical protein IPI78_16060 [Chitinophagaceae bacterium]|nr:hypothetical protein [Chitinophagaceae bacterium]